MNKKYEAIINLPHHVSTQHPHMSMHDRAAQFAAFAALTGHDAYLRETERKNTEYHLNKNKGKPEDVWDAEI